MSSLQFFTTTLDEVTVAYSFNLGLKLFVDVTESLAAAPLLKRVASHHFVAGQWICVGRGTGIEGGKVTRSEVLDVGDFEGSRR